MELEKVEKYWFNQCPLIGNIDTPSEIRYYMESGLGVKAKVCGLSDERLLIYVVYYYYHHQPLYESRGLNMKCGTTQSVI